MKIKKHIITLWEESNLLCYFMVIPYVLKDPYNFDFLSLAKGYNEKELEDALTNNITKYLMNQDKILLL